MEKTMASNQPQGVKDPISAQRIRNQVSKPQPRELDYHRKSREVKGSGHSLPTHELLDNNWWWISVLKNASSTMLNITDESKHYKNNYKFAIIRNPLDRLVSCWSNKSQNFKNCDSFDQFIRHCYNTEDGIIDAHAQSQYQYLEPYPDLLVNFDNIKEELEALGINLNVHTNATHHLHYCEYFTEELEELARERYKQDFELWDFVENINITSRIIN